MKSPHWIPVQFLVVLFALFSAFWFCERVFWLNEPLKPGAISGNRAAYEQGYNHALEHIALVNLEFATLKGTPKTFGELADICRERRGIQKGHHEEAP